MGIFEKYMYAWPERSCVDTAQDAEGRGTTIRNYAEVTALTRGGGEPLVTLDERAPGQQGLAQIHARILVRAAGPWIDRVPGGDSGKRRTNGLKSIKSWSVSPRGFVVRALRPFPQG